MVDREDTYKWNKYTQPMMDTYVNLEYGKKSISGLTVCKYHKQKGTNNLTGKFQLPILS